MKRTIYRARIQVRAAQPQETALPLLRLAALALAALAVLLLTAGCTPQQLRAYGVQPEPPAADAPTGNRLVVQSYDGNVFTVGPDGRGRVQVTSDASASRQYQQPTWGPDGETLALARVDDAGVQMVGALVLAGYDGTIEDEIPVPFPPFYIYWSPAGDRIAYLSNWQGLEGPSMALRLVDVAAGGVDTVAEGQPYYFSWSPNGEQLVAHVSNLRLELQEPGGDRTALLSTGGGFGAPQWSADGARLVYALVDEQGQRLVVGDTAGKPLNEVTTFDERISFSLNSSGDQVAYVLTPATSTANTLGPLYLAEVESGRTRQLSEEPVWAFHWSPDGQKLAFIATDNSDGRLWMRWFVWDGEQVTPYARFLPTRTFLERYVVFSDQYAQSMRVWSPDSSAFVYPGTNDAGRRGIWVQTLGEEAPRWVAGGVMASWSPR
jgi:TolB protein